ncbi:Transposase [Wolbachia endosymbiont of Cylisticus convexus]|nr:Transposase [Wolbachia endosymbiont of Cylisticus convexus]
MYVQYIGYRPKWQKRSTGFYLAESEGANFWLGVLNDLKERGVEDILIACVDGLKSFPTAINSVFPNAEMYSASNKEFIEICIEQRCESFYE